MVPDAVPFTMKAGRATRCVAGAAATLACAASVARAAPEPPSPPLPTPVDAIGENTARAFGVDGLPFFGAAIVSTAALVTSGGDHAVRLAVQRDLHSRAWGDTAVYGGYVVPVVLPLGLWLGGLAARDEGPAGAGSAALQALVVSQAAVVLLKVGTGRPFPRSAGSDVPQAPYDRPEYARDFVPFGFSGRYAWPSGHTAAAFSLAASLSAHAGDSLVVPLVAYPLAAGVAGGMLVGDHHWASDVVAGALLGQAIGWSIGRSFRDRRRGPSRVAGVGLRLVPLVGGGVTGCSVWLDL